MVNKNNEQPSIVSLRLQIRFALEQLKVKNHFHTFEDLCREYSRQRICRNILPATGPVSGGGDHGRDFETFPTYLDADFSLEDTRVFEGSLDNGNVFFACSTQKNVSGKIKTDIRSIFSYTAERRPVVFFCTEDLPIGKRHELQKWCNAEYNVTLTIHDGQALAENLSDPDIFWIAVEYLSLPAAIYPVRMDDDVTYSKYRSHWFSRDRQPHNYADFCQIKYGLRHSTFTDALKPDLPHWLSIMTTLESCTAPHLQRKVRYEICVAALRGQNNLDAYRQTVDDYFAAISNIQTLEELADACILLSYCSAAKLHGAFSVSSRSLTTVTKKLVDIIDASLKKELSVNQRCRLLAIKAHSCALGFVSSDGSYLDKDGMFQHWIELVDLLGHAPFYPIEEFSDTLTQLTPFIGEDERFVQITGRLDQLIAERYGGFAAAEKCRDRAIAFHKAGNTILAIDHLHRAKISWFKAETLRGALIALRYLAVCYEELGLSYAAKYCVYSSFFVAFDSNRDDLYDVCTASLFDAAKITYNAGDWYSFFLLMKPALMTHQLFDAEPMDLMKHEPLMEIFHRAGLVNMIARDYWPAAHEVIQSAYQAWPLDEYSRSEMDKIMMIESDSKPPVNVEKLWANIDGHLCGRPFGDFGNTRQIVWMALGIRWLVSFDNTYDTTMIAEEFVATLQVILVDFARKDIELLPVNVGIQLSLSDDLQFDMAAVPGNQQLQWQVKLVRHPKTQQDKPGDRLGRVFECAVTVLSHCSTLEYDDFYQVIKSSLESGLMSKAFFARPYPEIFKSLFDDETFDADIRKKVGVFEECREYQSAESEALAWKSGDGLSFCPEKAVMHAQNRYERLEKLMAIIWPQLKSGSRHTDFFHDLHQQGYLDWHIALIACNTVANQVCREVVVPVEYSSESDYNSELNRVLLGVINGEYQKQVEDMDMESIDTGEFERQREISFLTIMKTWGLSVHTATPPFDAIKKLLSHRYRIFEMDADHEPLF